jgi:hypothetical protein
MYRNDKDKETKEDEPIAPQQRQSGKKIGVSITTTITMAATRSLGTSSSIAFSHNPGCNPFPFPCNINLSSRASLCNTIPISHKHLLMARGSGRPRNSKVIWLLLIFQF